MVTVQGDAAVGRQGRIGGVLNPFLQKNRRRAVVERIDLGTMVVAEDEIIDLSRGGILEATGHHWLRFSHKNGQQQPVQ